MKPLDEVPAQLKALEHMSTEELNEFCRKHGQRMKPIRSKRLLNSENKNGTEMLILQSVPYQSVAQAVKNSPSSLQEIKWRLKNDTPSLKLGFNLKKLRIFV